MNDEGRFNAAKKNESLRLMYSLEKMFDFDGFLPSLRLFPEVR